MDKRVLLINDPMSVGSGDGQMKDNPGQLLVRGPLVLAPLEKTSHFVDFKMVQKGVKNFNMAEFNSLQKSVTPHLLRGDDCFIMGGVGSGKTLSYLIPMMVRFLKECEKESVTPEKGADTGEAGMKHRPLTLIVCADKDSVLKIETYLYHILSGRNQRYLSWMALTEKKHRNILQSQTGLDIVVTTVHFLYNLLVKSPAYFGFGRMRCLVFEDVDIVLKAFEKEFDYLYSVIEVAGKHSRLHLQRIFVGKEWCSEVENLYMSLEPIDDKNPDPCVPTVFINSANQAIRYSNMKWTIHSCQEDEKNEILTNLLQSEELYSHKEIVVACRMPEVARNVFSALSNQRIPAILMDSENMTRDTLDQQQNQWCNSVGDEQRILVVDDGVFREVPAYNVTCLVHFDLPWKTSTGVKMSIGAERFRCMWRNFRSVGAEKTNPGLKLKRIPLEAHFLLNGNEPSHVLYRFKLFAEKMGCSIPDSIATISDEAEQELIQTLPLCSGIQQFGRCKETVPSKCKARHQFLLSELETEPVVPRHGEIEVKIAECENPSLYTAQVLRCYEQRGGKRRLKCSLISRFKEISEKLEEYYRLEDHRIPPESLSVGTPCAVQNADGLFRARVRKIYTRGDHGFPKQLGVFCIDTGYYLQPMADSLFHLPEEIRSFPQLAINLVLANLKPNDDMRTYESSAISHAKDLTNDKILNGKVQFAVGETVWVNPLVDLGLDEAHDVKTRSSIRLSLIHSGDVDNNDSHMNTILKLCRDTGFECSQLLDANNPLNDSQFMAKFQQIDDDYSWAFIPLSTASNPERVEVWTSMTENPHRVFATNGKFDDQLQAVQDELNDTIGNMIEGRCKEYNIQFAPFYQLGQVVAVKDRESEMWSRGLIVDVTDNGSRMEYKIFLVDIGDTQSETSAAELFPIPRILVTKLPFQATLFQLTHVVPLDASAGWTEGAVDFVCELTLNSEQRLALDVVAFELLDIRSVPCRCYSAVILNADGQDLGELLVQSELAKFTQNGKDLVNTVKKNVLVELNALFDGQHATDFEDSDSGRESEDLFDVVGFDNDANRLLEEMGIKEDRSVGPSTYEKQIISHPSEKAAYRDGPVEGCIRPEVPSHDPAAAFSSLKHPDVLWRQSQTEFILKIEHADIKEYKIIIERKNISFRTLDPPNYGFDIECYGTIANTADVFVTGQYLRMTIKKRTIWLWPRPLVQKEKLRWLRQEVDMDNFNFSDDEDQDRDERYIYLPREGNATSESDSDDDGEEQRLIPELDTTHEEE